MQCSLDGTVRNVCGVKFSPDGTFDLPAVSDLLMGFRFYFITEAQQVLRRVVTLFLQTTNAADNQTQLLFADVRDTGQIAPDCLTMTNYMTQSLVFAGQTPFVNSIRTGLGWYT